METARYLKLNAEQFKFPRGYFNRNKKKVVDGVILKLKRGSKILDAGCGSGLISSCLDGYKIFGIDGSAESVEFCKKTYPKNSYEVMDLEGRLKFESEYFDGIIFTEAIEHLNHPDKAIAELKRVLKKGGVLVITTPNYDSIKWKFIEKTYYPIFGGECIPGSKDVHPSKFTKSWMTELLKKYFKDVEIGTFNFGMWLYAICYK